MSSIYFMKEIKKESKVHMLALTIAILGPLINFWIKPIYGSFITSPYVYWAISLLIYIGILIPFVSRSFLTLLRLIILGITVEDFFSNLWSFLFGGGHLLPFYNWYAGYFPFFSFLGKPTPYILIPRWYILALFAYLFLTVIQYRKHLSSKLNSSHRRKPENIKI